MAEAIFAAPMVAGRDYRWWVGQDNNVWANIEGIGVQNLGQASGVYKNRAQNQGLDESKWIADPNKPASNSDAQINQTGSVNYGGSGSSTSYTKSASEIEAERKQKELEERMRGIYDKQIEDINNNLGSLDSQLQNNLDAVKGEYDQYKNEQQSSYDQNKNDYDKSTLQNLQNLETNRNDITNRASSGLRGLLRVLGAMGAGGGSVARYEAPNMVTAQANQEMNNANQTYATNQQNLDTDWGNYENEFDNDKKKLEDWYNGQVKSKKQENYEKGQSLLADLVTAYGNRAQYGGDPSDKVANAYGRIANLRDQINGLGKFTTPNYTGKTAVYNAPDLSHYDTGNTRLATTVAEGSTSATSPLLVALQGLNKKKTNSPYTNKEA